MTYLFPYWMIERGSRVALWGFGQVGKSFFMQMQMFGYAECVLVADKSFTGYKKIVLPFAYPDSLADVDFDYVVIAVLDKEIADNIKDSILQICGTKISENQIIWSEYYSAQFSNWPMNKTCYLNAPDFYKEIIKKYIHVGNANWKFSRYNFYQSYSEIGITGVRNTQERIAIYKCRDILKETDKVLDIGCNCGFFDLQISPYVAHITGLDVQPEFIDIANKTKRHLGIKNATFICGNFSRIHINNSFDVIFSLAIHSNLILDCTENEYVRKIVNNLSPKGLLVFESHNLVTDRDLFNRLVKKFCAFGLGIININNYFSDFDRDVVTFRKDG